MNLESYLKHLEEKTKEHGVKLKLKNRSFLVIDGGKTNGYFSEDPPELGVAINQSKKIWVPVLIHEDSHLDQWIEQDPSYKNTWIKSENLDATDIVFQWVRGRNFPQNLLEEAIRLTRELELNCERRALKKIRKYSLPITEVEYIPPAGANIHQYNYMLLTRTNLWRGNKRPYENEEILKTMPKTLRGSFTRLTKQQFQAFEKFTKNP